MESFDLSKYTNKQIEEISLSLVLFINGVF